MENQHLRTELLIGSDAVLKLKNSHVAVFGVGGVGGYCVEALARAGVGHLTLIDNDIISESNLNRQIIALHSTIGMKKTEAVKNRILDINKCAKVDTYDLFYLPENADLIDLSQFDYVADAIDTVSAKIELACRCYKKNIPLISSMGTGNKLDPLAFEVSDIYKTSVCPLARVMRRELKQRGIPSLLVVYSKEKPQKTTGNRDTVGSISYCPSCAGLIMASKIISDIIGLKNR